MNTFSKIPKNFYLHDNVTHLAKGLLGKVLCSKIDGETVKAYISETEAYNGMIDKACHAYNGRRTPRTEIMFHNGGKAYIYLCYGIHHLFNVVTGPEGDPKAVLVRGIIPVYGIDVVENRLKKKVGIKAVSGPGNVSKAMGFHTKMTGELLSGDKIWIEEQNIVPKNEDVEVTTRIGVDYAGEDAKLPYRFIWNYYK